jgi:threonylcarbamoyladenosine tRNA methylthiotransferase MtaB
LSKRVFFKTFGCRTNQFDTQVMMQNLGVHTISQSESDCDVVVVNSCTVTNGADSSVRGYISSLKRKNPNARVILAGCGAYQKGEELLKQKKVFGIVGHSKKESIADFIGAKESFVELGDFNHIDETIVQDFIGKSRAFIKIQEGCDFECSYCIIPKVRGASRSHKETTILEQIDILAHNGFGEFILTGTNVGSYGEGTDTSLARLLKKISLIRGVRRVRIGSMEPSQIDSEFLELLDEPWMAKHLHIALQHTNDTMLERMKRNNRFAGDQKLFELIASRDYALGTDFIVAHPGESDALWQEALQRVEALPLTHIHAFTYSKRDGTESALMRDSVHGDTAKSRHRELTALIKDKNYRFRKEHSKNLEVLIEQSDREFYRGYDQYYNSVEVLTKEDIANSWVSLEEVEVKDEKNFSKI